MDQRFFASAERGGYIVFIVSHRLTASNVVTDPAGMPLSGSVAAGQVTRMLASDVVCVGGAIYVIFALKTASAGTLVG